MINRLLLGDYNFIIKKKLFINRVLTQHLKRKTRKSFAEIHVHSETSHE